jgi:hypothetical protein
MVAYGVASAVAILAVALTTAPAVAQSRPDTMSGTATIHRVNADSIASRMDAAVLVRVVAGQQVEELDSDDEGRRAGFLGRLGFAAAFTAVGAGLGYSWWHTCNDPESDAIFSCIVAPRRLATSVRFGAYTGLAVGLAGLLGDLKVAEQNKLVRAAGSGLLIDHHARSGFRIGANFRF